MATIIARTLNVEHRPAHVWRGGSGPALLFLHGGMGDTQLQWESLIAVQVMCLLVLATLRPHPVAYADLRSASLTSTVWLPIVIKSDPILVGAGDIATCNNNNDEATAQLLDKIGGTVFTLGDNTYPDGAPSEFANCYDPTWGRHKARTRPAPGNHDYHTLDASGYFNYFGAAAGNSSQGYYSYEVGAWHIIVINSNCANIGGCGAGSPQEQWLRADLAAHGALCTLAYWHHPLFSSGPHLNNTMMRPIWQALYDYNADVVLGGHDHDYERFAPQDSNGTADSARGIREFVVGTGGMFLYTFTVPPSANTEVRNATTYGVLKLTVHAVSYDWEFVPVAGSTFADSGSTACH